MQNYQEELRLQKATMPPPWPDSAEYEDIATKAVLRQYLDNVTMEDASLTKGEERK